MSDGEGDPPIFFVHGFACDQSDWLPLFDILASRYSLVACDLPDHGASPGRPGSASVEAYGAAVAGLLAESEVPPAVLVGHSMGCRVALEAYASAPDRVAAMVLLDGSYIGAGDRLAAEQGMSDQLDSLGYQAFVRDFFEAMFTEGSDPELKAGVIERSALLPAATGTALLTSLAGWDASRLAGVLASVTVPVLVIQSTSMGPDRVRVPLTAGQSSPWLELIRAQQPGARVEILLGQGHFPHLETPDAVAALIDDFVSGLTATAPGTDVEA